MKCALSFVLFFLSFASVSLAQVGENCLPSLTQTVRQSWLDGNTPVYLIDLNFTNTGYNTNFQESTPHNQDSLPLASVDFDIVVSGSIVIVQTWSMQPYPAHAGTFVVDNINVAVGESFTGAGYIVRGGVPVIHSDVWSCVSTSSSPARSTPASTSAAATTAPASTTTTTTAAAPATSNAVAPAPATTTASSCLSQTGISFSLQSSWIGAGGAEFNQYAIVITNNGATPISDVEFEIRAEGAFTVENSWGMIGYGWTNPAVQPVALDESVQIAAGSNYNGIGFICSGSPTTSLELASVRC